MITGGIASIIYGEPRTTEDIDLVMQLRVVKAGALAAAFPAAEFYVPPIEVIEEEARREASGHFNLVHHETGLRADIYLSGDDPLQAWGLGRRLPILLRDEPISLAPIEYVIVAKLRYVRGGGSARHLEDIAAMLRISGDRIDHAELARKITEQGLDREWAQARRAGPS